MAQTFMVYLSSAVVLLLGLGIVMTRGTERDGLVIIHPTMGAAKVSEKRTDKIS
jgi:hypothetical protein